MNAAKRREQYQQETRRRKLEDELRKSRSCIVIAWERPLNTLTAEETYDRILTKLKETD